MCFPYLVYCKSKVDYLVNKSQLIYIVFICALIQIIFLNQNNYVVTWEQAWEFEKLFNNKIIYI